MSTELLVETAKTERTVPLEYDGGTFSPNGKVQQVWCAPMSEAGEWVITWTRLPGAVTYELQTSLEPGQWGCVLKFSGTRAVLLLGPVPRCCVRVRAIGFDGPGEWSAPSAADKGDRCSVAA